MAVVICKPKCKSGYICRKAYTTKRGVHVKATCITDQGVKGKTPAAKKIPLKHPLARGPSNPISLRGLQGGTPHLLLDKKSCRLIGRNAKKKQVSQKQLVGKFNYIQNVNKNTNKAFSKKLPACRDNALAAFRSK